MLCLQSSPILLKIPFWLVFKSVTFRETRTDEKGGEGGRGGGGRRAAREDEKKV